MLLEYELNFQNNQAQNIVIGKVGSLDPAAPNGRINYLTLQGSQGLYLKREGIWVNLSKINPLAQGGIKVSTISGVEYISVEIDNKTIVIDAENKIKIAFNSIGNDQLDNANIRIGDFASPNKNFSMAGYKITSLGAPENPTDAVNKEYVDYEIALAVSSTGDFIGDWSGPGYPIIGSGIGGLIRKGDWWRISSVFTLGTVQLEVGDALFSKENSSGTNPFNWFTLQNNVGEATSTALGLVRTSESTDLTANAGSNTNRVVRIADLLLRTATKSRTGLIQLATDLEIEQGLNETKAVTPKNLKSLKSGIDIELVPKGITINKKTIGGIKKEIESDETLEIPDLWQYNVLGSLDIDGTVDVDGEIHIEEIGSASEENGEFVKKTGDTMTGSLNVIASVKVENLIYGGSTNETTYGNPNNLSIQYSGVNMSGKNLKRWRLLYSNLVLSFTNTLEPNEHAYYTFIFIQDAIGGREVTFPSEIIWNGGVPPVISGNPNEATVITLLWTGVEYLGSKHCGYTII